MNRSGVATGPSMTVRSIAEFSDRLRACAEVDLVIDITDLSDVDLSFIQLVEVVRREAASSNKTIRLSGPVPERLKALLERSGYAASAAPDDLLFWFQGDISQ